MKPALPFSEALKDVAKRKLLPTNMSSAELSRLSRDVTNNSFFSARNTLTDLLQGQKDKVLALTQGTTDLATARAQIKLLAAELGYEPDADHAGGLHDLSSEPRINLVLKTNTQIAQGYGYDRQGQTDAILDQWPAQELFRAEARTVERGEKRTKEGIVDDPDNSWQERFRTAGAASGEDKGWVVTDDGRMIALKNHPIWDELGNPDNFDDALGNPYPPFAFNSGMDVMDVDRDTAVALGLIDEDTQIDPRIEPFTMEAAA